MNKSDVITLAIICVMTVSACAPSSDDSNAVLIEEHISEGAQCVVEATDEISSALQAAEKEAEKERLAELGYPEEYNPTNPVANGEFEEEWDAIQNEDAMKSLAEDAMRDYYSEPPDISDGVIKP